MSHRAHMIGAGIGNLAAAVYLLRDGQWDGSNITIYGRRPTGRLTGGPKGLPRTIGRRSG